MHPSPLPRPLQLPLLLLLPPPPPPRHRNPLCHLTTAHPRDSSCTRQAFLHSENPIEVRAGYVGSLRISFPKLMEVHGLSLGLGLGLSLHLSLSASLSASSNRSFSLSLRLSLRLDLFR